jgi:FlaA1/EpsC-like NDP-sugar epimerase
LNVKAKFGYKDDVNKLMPSPLQIFFSFPRLAQLGLDMAISALAFWGAYVLRFEGVIPTNGLVGYDYAHQFLILLPCLLVLRFALRFPLGLHQQLWRYVSLNEARDITVSISLGSLVLIALSHSVLRTHVPWGIWALDWGINVIGYLGLRAIRRSMTERQPHRSVLGDRTPILLVGAGQAGHIFAKELRQANASLELVGFVDDDPHKRHSRVLGMRVLGTTRDIPELVAKYRIGEVILCLPSASREEMRRILDLCLEVKVKTKTLPALKDLIAGRVEIGQIRPVEIEDLLGREPVSFDRAAVAGYLEGRVVLVTGAGGSIGSELCRQIAALNPARLLLLGRGEFSIYSIEMEMKETFPALEVLPLIGDVRDAQRMAILFGKHQPQVVFHAAAHKHVPLMESNPSEAVLNNIFGTRTVAELCDRTGVETFVLISSDKAVNPTNVMGACKRGAEMIVQELATRSQTRFMSVRFGNVLGSRGSVIPLFKRQIAAGGPITITHPDIIRYFMTIPEASQLVLQAGALGEGGEVFVLDMGQPVKIVDLAHDLIRLSGLEPETDIPIRFTGLRPGEKLFEELLTSEEGTASTRHRKIFIAHPEAIARAPLEQGLERLRSVAILDDMQAIRFELKALVPTYQEPNTLQGRLRAQEPKTPSPLSGEGAHG